MAAVSTTVDGSGTENVLSGGRSTATIVGSGGAQDVQWAAACSRVAKTVSTTVDSFGTEVVVS